MLPIQGWDYYPSSCMSGFSPVFYFIPDYEWVAYLNIHGPINIPIQISGSKKYDGHYWIKIDKQPDTLWHVGFLPFPFDGPPPNMGHVALDPWMPDIPQFLECELNGCC